MQQLMQVLKVGWLDTVNVIAYNVICFKAYVMFHCAITLTGVHD